ncbi:hypothetical protein, partial [Streptomyces sp. b94]|uniref:hypothetical protein n=1 Tax=Streptomyces sp. b94 TaxID=1827634 RepID=UPI00211D1E9D
MVEVAGPGRRGPGGADQHPGGYLLDDAAARQGRRQAVQRGLPGRLRAARTQRLRPLARREPCLLYTSLSG